MLNVTSSRLLFVGIGLVILILFYPKPIQPSVSMETGLERVILEELDSERVYIPFINLHAGVKEMSLPLILSVIRAESNFNPLAVSRKGALGLMQLMPETALAEYRDSGIDTSLRKIKKHLLEQPELNIFLGLNHLKKLEDRLAGVTDPVRRKMLIVASYNAGIHRVKRAFNCKGFDCYLYRANHYSNRRFKGVIRSLPRETRTYLTRIEHHYRGYKEILTRE